MRPLRRSALVVSLVAVAALAVAVAPAAAAVGPPLPVAPGEPSPPPLTNVAVVDHLVPEPDLFEPTPAPVEAVIRTLDPNVVHVTFWSGTRTCYGLQRVEVEETDEQVTIGIFTGSRPPVPQVCIAVAVPYSTTVTLAEPLGGRTVVDASALADVADPPVDPPAGATGACPRVD